MQVPSAFSALKVGGRKMCDIARAGGEVAPQPRPVTIHELEYLGRGAQDGYLLRVKCSKGTYIRALCHDIGRALSLRRAHALSLRISVQRRVFDSRCVYAGAG